MEGSDFFGNDANDTIMNGGGYDDDDNNNNNDDPFWGHNDHHGGSNPSSSVNAGLLGAGAGLLAGGLVGNILGRRSAEQQQQQQQRNFGLTPPVVGACPSYGTVFPPQQQQQQQYYYQQPNHLGGGSGLQWSNSNQPPPHHHHINTIYNQPNPNWSPPQYHQISQDGNDRNTRKSSIMCCLFFVFFVVLIAFLLSWPQNNEKDWLLVPGNRVVVPIDKGIERINLSGSTQVSAYYYTKSHLPLLDDILVYPEKHLSLNINTGSFQFVRYDLHENSLVDIEYNYLSANFAPKFIIIKGVASFRMWVKHKSVRRGAIVHQGQGYSGEYSFTTGPGHNSYFIIFYPQSFIVSASGKASINVQAVTYGIDGYDGKCDSVSLCSFSIDDTSKGAKVLLVAPPTGTDAYIINLRTIVSPAILNWWYVGYILAGIALFVTFCYCCCYSCCCKKEREGYEPLGDGDNLPPPEDGPPPPPFNPHVVPLDPTRPPSGAASTSSPFLVVGEPPVPSAPPPKYSMFPTTQQQQQQQ